MLLPVVLSPPAGSYDAPLFPLLRTAIETIGLEQLGLLLLAGVLLGFVTQKRMWLLGLAAIAPLPVAAVLEMLVDPSSHNLFPFEFLLYGLYSLIVVAGLVAARMIRRAVRSRADHC